VGLWQVRLSVQWLRTDGPDHHDTHPDPSVTTLSGIEVILNNTVTIAP